VQHGIPAVTKRFDRRFLTSNWSCIWGRGCQGIGPVAAPELGYGCCSLGAELDGMEEALTLAANADALSPDIFQFHAEAATGGVFRDEARDRLDARAAELFWKMFTAGNVSAEALRIAKEMERARKEAEKASREARRYRQELEEYQATAEMREHLLRAGVREDVDYALDLMRRDINAKLQTDPELASYSTEEFLKSLRSNKPFLFGEARVAATTGTGGEGPQARPAAPGQAASTIAQGEQFDARKASAEQIKARLAQLGVQYSRQ
jgi:hypothetical protein